jgi:HK97 gp10 family phage protein
MSIKGEIRWEGLEAFRNYVTGILPRAIQDSAEIATDRAGDDGLERMIQSCPVDKGDLKSTCRKRSGREPTQANTFHVTLIAGGMRGKVTGRMVDYAKYPEHGTSRQRPQPYLWPALMYASRRVEPYFWEELSRRVEID